MSSTFTIKPIKPHFIIFNQCQFLLNKLLSKGSYGSVYSYLCQENGQFLALKTFEDNEFLKKELVEIIHPKLKKWVKAEIFSFNGETLEYLVKTKTTNEFFLKTFDLIRPDLLYLDDLCVVKINPQLEKKGKIIDKNSDYTKYLFEFEDKTEWYLDSQVFRSMEGNYPIRNEYQKEKKIIQKLFLLPQMNLIPATYNDKYGVVIMPKIKMDLYFLSKKKKKKSALFFKTLITEIGHTLIHLANNGMYYADLKDRNVLYQVGSKFEFYLADLGSIVELDRRGIIPEAVMTYPPPEFKDTEGVINNQNAEQILAGMVWSFGVLIMQQIPDLEPLSNDIIYTTISSLNEEKFVQKIINYKFDLELVFLKGILVSCFQPKENDIHYQKYFSFPWNRT